MSFLCAEHWRLREPPSLFERPTGYYGATESYFVPCVGIRRSPGCPVNSHRSSLGPSAQRFADSAPAHSPSNMPQVRQWLGRESEPRVPGHRKIGGVPGCFQGEIRAFLPHIRVNGYRKSSSQNQKWRPREPPSLFERPTGYYGATESYFGYIRHADRGLDIIASRASVSELLQNMPT